MSLASEVLLCNCSFTLTGPACGDSGVCFHQQGTLSNLCLVYCGPPKIQCNAKTLGKMMDFKSSLKSSWNFYLYCLAFLRNLSKILHVPKCFPLCMPANLAPSRQCKVSCPCEQNHAHDGGTQWLNDFPEAPPSKAIILVIALKYMDSRETGTFRKQHQAILQIIYFHLSPITNL